MLLLVFASALPTAPPYASPPDVGWCPASVVVGGGSGNAVFSRMALCTCCVVCVSAYHIGPFEWAEVWMKIEIGVTNVCARNREMDIWFANAGGLGSVGESLFRGRCCCSDCEYGVTTYVSAWIVMDSVITIGVKTAAINVPNSKEPIARWCLGGALSVTGKKKIKTIDRKIFAFISHRFAIRKHTHTHNLMSHICPNVLNLRHSNSSFIVLPVLSDYFLLI